MCLVGKPLLPSLRASWWDSCSTGANAESATTDYPQRRSRSQGNLGFQPDWSCRLPSLLIRDQAGCRFDETGKMPVLPVTPPHEKFAQAENFHRKYYGYHEFRVSHFEQSRGISRDRLRYCSLATRARLPQFGSFLLAALRSDSELPVMPKENARDKRNSSRAFG